jgi:hypothetical protein
LPALADAAARRLVFAQQTEPELADRFRLLGKYLNSTGVGDKGLAHLAGPARLETLDLRRDQTGSVHGPGDLRRRRQGDRRLQAGRQAVAEMSGYWSGGSGL